jgi:cytochrome b involved in lipid metabolism
MVLIGFSILVASLSFLCYKHPPSSWSFVTWLQGALKRHGREGITAAPHQEVQSKEDNKQNIETKADLDRKSMPPPPPPSFRMSSVPTTSAPPSATKTTAAGSASALPNFTMNESSSLPAFPAINSIQRASGGRAPPRLNSLPVAQPPLRSINTLSPSSSRSPLPNRSSVASSSSLALPPSLTAIPAKPRLKVQLTPGHSPLDWAHLSSRPNANLRGLPPSTPYLRVSPSLLRQYTGRKGKDAWTMLGGKVYNITPYLPYHPGGVPELMKAAGRDGTKLFGEIHPWVNWEGMLESCLIGVAVGEEESKSRSSLEDMD